MKKTRCRGGAQLVQRDLKQASWVWEKLGGGKTEGIIWQRLLLPVPEVPGSQLSPQPLSGSPRSWRCPQKAGERKRWKLSAINIKDFSGLTNGEADVIAPSVGGEELEKKIIEKKS